MTFIDSHAHIYLKEFEEDRLKVIERAKEEEVRKILMPAIDSTTHESMLKAELENSNICLSMMGLHPCSVKENFADELKIAREYLEKRPFKAVGETGLDFYWDKTFTEQQYAAFREQIQWALEYDIPVVIHSRNSIDECISVVKENQKGSLKGVFHCFSGSLDQAKQIIGLGFYLGIGGVVTFKNSGLESVMKEVDLKNIVLETDAPYLAPVPFRGKRNECSYIKYVAQKLAEIKNTDLKQIAEITTSNAEELFNLE